MANLGNRGILIVSKHFMIFLILLVFLLQPIAVANANEAALNDTLVCMDAAMKYEKEYGIQQHMLATIATVETGRWNSEFQRKMAWPWSINVRGKSYYYDSKQEAIAAVDKFRKRGFKSIDVGCMQINLVHHAKGFNSLEEAFDPYKNVEYAAKFLTKLNKRRQDWMHAATDYHSKKPTRARRYKTRLLLAMIEVEEGHEQLVKVFNPPVIEQQEQRNWFAKFFDIFRSSDEPQKQIEVADNSQPVTEKELKLTLNDKEPEI